MADNDDEPKTGERQQAHLEIVTGAEAQAALVPEAVRRVVRNLVESNLDRPKLSKGMSRDEVRSRLDLYGYPRSILRQERLSVSRIGSMVQGVMDCLRQVCSSPIYDPNAFQARVSAEQSDLEEWVAQDVVHIASAGDMVVAKMNGTVAGIAGHKHVGVAGGRNVHEISRVSVLKEHRGRNIFPRLAAEVMNALRRQCPADVAIVHTKNPRVRAWAVAEGFHAITFEEYVSKHDAWDISPDRMESLGQIQSEQGWEYFELDLASQGSK